MKKEMNRSSSGKVICVLGMHRSGTSCLIGSLQKAGVYLGKHNTWSLHNERGNRENQDIFELQEDLIASNNGTWKNPPNRVIWSKWHIDWARRIINDLSQDGPWGFKDPKTLITLDGWKTLLGDIHFVGIFRHPVWVAQSLFARGKGVGISVPKEEAFEMWNYYNLLLLREYYKKEFPILSFDWDEEYFHEKLNKVIQQLGLQELSPEDRFFTPKLRHYNGVPKWDAPVESMEIYRELNEVCV